MTGEPEEPLPAADQRRPGGSGRAREGDPIATTVADIERFALSAARLISRGPNAFFDPDDDLLRRAGRSIIVDVAAALERVPSAVRDAHPEVPWRAIRGARNIVAHAYDRVNDDLIWNALDIGIPQLVDALRSLRGSRPAR